MTIRGAVPADADGIACLLGELGAPATRGEVVARLAGLGGRDPVFVADDGGAVIGLLALQIGPQLHRARPVARITALVVTDAMRGRDWGLRLVQHGIAVARERGCGTIELASPPDRAQAHGFYQAAGFAITAQRFSKDL